MTYQTSPFGNRGDSSNVKSDVSNHYGPRNTGGTVGQFLTFGTKNEIGIDLTGEMLNQDKKILVAPVLPVGAIITGVNLKVDEAFDLGGTSPGVEIGTVGSEATNGVSLTESDLETVQTLVVTAAKSGTWNDPLTVETKIGIVLSGTSPTVDPSVGKARVIINYVMA